MFKLVVLLSAVALSAAQPFVLSPLTLSSIHAVPLTVAQRFSSVVHPSPGLIGVPPVHSIAAVAPLDAVAPGPLALWAHSPTLVLNALNAHGLHLLKKRSLVGPLGHSAVVALLSGQIISSHAAVSPLVHSVPRLHSASLHSGVHA